MSMLLLTCADVLLRLGVTLYHNYRWGFLEGVLPMLIALILCNLIILFFPQIALFLPNLMR